MHTLTLTPSHTLGLTSCSMCDGACWLETDIPLPRGSALSHRKLECELGHTRREEKMGGAATKTQLTTDWNYIMQGSDQPTNSLFVILPLLFFFVCYSSDLKDDCREKDAQENINSA